VVSLFNWRNSDGVELKRSATFSNVSLSVTWKKYRQWLSSSNEFDHVLYCIGDSSLWLT
jgi:hypothetical protein